MNHDICAVFHYVPLHSSIAGKKYGTFVGADRYTTRESDRLVRLPMFNALTDEEVKYVVNNIKRFYSGL
jgi:dTDP-4-amino-4,6-dideoxygalactose transaminase